MVRIGHRLLAVGAQGCRCRPVEIEDSVHPGVGDRLRPAGDILLIGAAADRHAVDAKPAILVERHPYGVDVPRRDRLNLDRIRRAIGEGWSAAAGVFRPGTVDSVQDHRRIPFPQLVPLHVETCACGSGLLLIVERDGTGYYEDTCKYCASDFPMRK